MLQPNKFSQALPISLLSSFNLCFNSWHLSLLTLPFLIVVCIKFWFILLRTSFFSEKESNDVESHCLNVLLAGKKVRGAGNQEGVN